MIPCLWLSVVFFGVFFWFHEIRFFREVKEERKESCFSYWSFAEVDYICLRFAFLDTTFRFSFGAQVTAYLWLTFLVWMLDDYIYISLIYLYTFDRVITKRGVKIKLIFVATKRTVNKSSPLIYLVVIIYCRNWRGGVVQQVSVFLSKV